MNNLFRYFFVLSAALNLSGNVIAQEPVPENKVAGATARSIDELFDSELAAKGVTARLYDTDKDGILQAAELINYFDDIISFVDRRGGYIIKEDMDFLTVFDQDSNGVLDRQECWNIKNTYKNKKTNK
jgi:hypothetical protein